MARNCGDTQYFHAKDRSLSRSEFLLSQLIENRSADSFHSGILVCILGLIPISYANATVLQLRFSMLYVDIRSWCLHVANAVSDALGIYLLNLLLAFLQPRFDPSLEEDLLADEIEGGAVDEAPSLPSQRDDEFRPFVRRLPEWQFW
jgi:hypothetical protein